MDTVEDKLRMVGVLPSVNAGPIPVGKIPDGVTEVKVSGTANNETTTIHTVTAGKTLYLSFWTLDYSNESGATSYCSLQVDNGSDVLQYRIANPRCPDGGYNDFSGNMIPPMEIPAGYKVKLVSTDENMYARAFIHGYEA